MQTNTEKNYLTIREVAKTGLLSEYAIRLLLKQGKIPAIYIGNKALINYPLLIEQLNEESRKAVCHETENC